jgi:hypothetical protein
MLKITLVYSAFILFQLLVEINCQKESTQFLAYLSQDITNLLDDSKNYDVIISVDENNEGTFYAHSSILIARSSYFKDIFYTGMVNKENNIFTFYFPHISVNTFNILIR